MDPQWSLPSRSHVHAEDLLIPPPTPHARAHLLLSLSPFHGGPRHPRHLGEPWWHTGAQISLGQALSQMPCFRPLTWAPCQFSRHFPFSGAKQGLFPPLRSQKPGPPLLSRYSQAPELNEGRGWRSRVCTTTGKGLLSSSVFSLPTG